MTLPNRHQSSTYRFEHGKARYLATVSFSWAGKPMRLFLTTGKVGSELEALARDMAVVTSIALEGGVVIDDLRSALTRLDDGGAAGPLGILLDMLEEEMALSYPLTDAEISEIKDWQAMDSFPRDGTKCVIKFKHGTAQPGLFWGAQPIGGGMGIRGDESMLSPNLVPVAWSKQEKEYGR